MSIPKNPRFLIRLGQEEPALKGRQGELGEVAAIHVPSDVPILLGLVIRSLELADDPAEDLLQFGSEPFVNITQFLGEIAERTPPFRAG